MKLLPGQVAVVTGAGSGIGRELALQLVAQGCSVAICGLSEVKLAETFAACEAAARHGARVFARVADVTDEQALAGFRDAAARALETDRVHLLFNNAGIVGDGGGGFVAADPEAWQRIFDICWGGVYNGCRVFLPMLMAAENGCIVNVSSLNAVRAAFGPNLAPTAYSAAKFAVRGFTEALITDLRLNAPHLSCALVIPGHIGTDILETSRRILAGADTPAADNEESTRFRNTASVSAAEAAAVILDGVREGRWRILIGDDAVRVDALVRARPDDAYEPSFQRRVKIAALTGLALGVFRGTLRPGQMISRVGAALARRGAHVDRPRAP